MTTPTTTPHEDRQGVTKPQALEILEAHGIHRSMRTIERWIDQGILSIKRVTLRTVILFRDEVEALAAPEDPEDQRLDSARSMRRKVRVNRK